MFGILNPTKLLFTVLVVAAIWYGFKWLGRRAESTAMTGGGAKGDAKPGDAAKRDQAGDEAETVEMVRCKVCGDFQPQSRAAACGRDDCPY